MRASNLHRIIRTGLSYSMTLLLAMSIPINAVYADESPTLVPTQEAAVVATQEPAQSSPISEIPKDNNSATEPRRGSLAEWQARRNNSAASQPTEQVSQTPLVPNAATNIPVANSVDPSEASNHGSQSTSTDANSDTATTTVLSNALESLAKSGDAEIIKNTTGGNATSGNATVSASVINNVNSIVSNENNKEVATFVSNVMGDTDGDIILQPMLLKAMLEAKTASQLTNQINVTNSTDIQNDINLSAISGNAAVSSNTSAGNATSGSAHTVADVVNIVNSMVSANQSFIGTINIYGNLNGDILIAPDFIPQMLANNKQENSEQSGTSSGVTNTSTESIINNVSLAAESGHALVSGNTSAGNATTGNADTNLVIFNLTNHAIVAQDSILVFVNVLGKWVGVIVDAPVGASAAAIGSNISNNTTTSPNMTIDVDNSTQITNNIDLSSRSGNALVNHNTAAGNATSGNASASANILNLSNSQLSLNGWFGILFINVFGTWNGSFGVDTDAGTRVTISPPQSEHGNDAPPVIMYVPHEQHTRRSSAPVTVVAPSYIDQTSEAIYSPPSTDQSSAQDATSQVMKQSASPEVLGAMTREPGQVNVILLLGSLVLVGLSGLGIRRFIA